MRCIYCHQGQDKPAFCSIDQVDPQKVGSYFPREGRCRVTLFGGEPLFDFDYFCRVADAIKNRNPKAELNTITNGTLLTTDRAKTLNSLGMAVGLSHDGYNYERTRRTKDILKIDPEPYLTLDARSISATSSRINYDFYDIWDYFEEFTIRHDLKRRESCHIEVVKDVEGNTDENLLILDMPEWEKMLDKVFFNLEEQIKQGDCNGYEFMQYWPLILSLNYRIQTPGAICANCGADKNTCHIDIHGNLYPCHNMIRSDGHVDITGARAGGYNPYIDSERCGNCAAFILCGGGCIATPPHKFKYSCYTYYQQIIRMLAMLNRLQSSGIGGITSDSGQATV